jgi:uncharacterized protein (DUF2235 family)
MAAAKKKSSVASNPGPAKVAPKGTLAPSADVQTKEGKSIFLFADGTGNSSAKLFKTNVWRMYEAIDLGLASPGKRVQIAYYDNGVGTSNFRPLAMLGGIFGIGLKANVLRLYKFLCHNYQPNDRIYVFGFSRGAFTIRLLVGLVVSQGILLTNGDNRLSYQVRDAYRAFCAKMWPNRALARFFAHIFRAIRDGLITTKRKILGQELYSNTKRLHTDVEFVGVWDTVAAYGGPFAEFTRGIDDWIWPLTMPHYGLSAKVLKARHALALDDERDAFQPLLWDEYREAELINKGERVATGFDDEGKEIETERKVAPDRLKQVWFTGVHSDVGGGYPDESLSYISLLWMMDELSPDQKNPEVDFVDSFVQRAKDLANPYGPIHDSRSGLGAYYRYQPRKIAAMMDPPTIATKSLRDPEISRGKPDHGLLKSVKVHESVIARIKSGIDNYAPVALPANFDIIGAAGPNARPILTADDHTLLVTASAAAADREQHQENAWDLAWRRRLIYFATVGTSLLLVAAPLIKFPDFVEQLCSDDRCFAKSILNGGLFFLPASFRQMLEPWAEKPLIFILLVIVIAVLIAAGQVFERRFRDKVRKIWRQYLAGTLIPNPDSTKVRTFRESKGYQNLYFDLKWKVMPAIFGIATLATLILAGLAALTQTMYAPAEPTHRFCPHASDRIAADDLGGVAFDTRKCVDLGHWVQKDVPYDITLTVREPWADRTIPAGPINGAIDPPWPMKIAAPFKRVTSASWMEPLTEVRGDEGKPTPSWLLWLVSDVDIRKTNFRRQGATDVYVTRLCPERKGRLYLMVNDAAPLLLKTLYANNKGTASVKVARAENAVCEP